MKITLLFAGLVIIVLAQTNVDLSNALDLTKGFKISGGATNDLFQPSIRYAGDINKDGIDDLIVGAPMSSPSSRLNAGVVYVIYGKPDGPGHIDLISTPDLSQGFKISGAVAADFCGSSVAAAGDVNGDGVDDIIFGAQGFDGSGGSGTGAVYVIYGKIGGITAHIDLLTTLPLTEGFIIIGAGSYDQIGSDVSSAGDFNKDGVGDIIIGGIQVDNFAISYGGIAYVIYGQLGDRAAHLDLFSTPLTFSQGFKVSGSLFDDMLGCSVGSAGDINKDGINDVLVGVCGADTIIGYANAGAVLVIYGQAGKRNSNLAFTTGISLSEGFQISGPAVGSQIGTAVSPAGDINNDGIDDIIIGALYDSSKGVAYVIYGQVGNRASHIALSSGLSLSEGFKITGAATGDKLGVSVSFAGDINQDGVDDVLIGANSADAPGRTDAGAAYVIYGMTGGITAHIDLNLGLASWQGFQISGSTANDQAGNSVSYGDFNHDGAVDIVVSESNASPFGRTSAGAISILYSTPVCPTAHCIQCAGSRCLRCAQGYLLYNGDEKCYPKGSCPTSTTETSTHCVDEVIQAIAQVQSATSQAATIVTFAITLINFSNPGGMLFSALGETLLYMKYMSITYPPRLQERLNEPEYPIISIEYISEVPEAVEDAIPKYPLEDNFEKYELTSGFLVNFWSSVILLLIIGVGILISCFSVQITKKWKGVNSKFLRIKETLKWNYIIGAFAESCGPIAFYTSLQLTNLHFETQMESLSFSTCLLINIIIIAIAVKTILIASKLSQEKDQGKLMRIKQELEDYQVVFENYENGSFSQQGYFLFSCLRLYLFYVVLGNMYKYPILQAVIFNIQSLLFIFYLLLKRPLKERQEFIMALIMEFILLTVHTSVLGLAMIEHTKHMITDEAVTLGEIIIVCNILFISVQCVYLCIHIFGLAQSFYKFIKAKCSPKKGLPLDKNRTGIPWKKKTRLDQQQNISNILDHSIEVHELTGSRIHINNRMDTTFNLHNPGDHNNSKNPLEMTEIQEESMSRSRLHRKINKGGKNIMEKWRELHLPISNTAAQIEINHSNIEANTNHKHVARRKNKR